LDANGGATVASFKAPERCDQVIWDAANRRIYALGGEGYIGVFQQDDADHYRELARVPTAPGAKTGILVPEMKRLFVAVSPGEGRTGAAILRFEVAPAQQFYRLEASAVPKSPSPGWDYVTLDERRGYLFIGRRAVEERRLRAADRRGLRPRGPARFRRLPRRQAGAGGDGRAVGASDRDARDRAGQ